MSVIKNRTAIVQWNIMSRRLIVVIWRHSIVWAAVFGMVPALQKMQKMRQSGSNRPLSRGTQMHSVVSVSVIAAVKA